MAFDPAVVVAGMRLPQSRSATSRRRENVTDRIPEQRLRGRVCEAPTSSNDECGISKIFGHHGGG
jgi:hypothetical protein